MKHKTLQKETIEKMRLLYKKNLSTKKISERLKIPYSTVYVHTRVFSGEFNSPNEYHEHLAKQRGYKSFNEYRKQWVEEKGFNSLSKYIEYQVKKKGFETLSKYTEHLTKKKQEKEEYKKLKRILQENLKERGRQSWLANQVNITSQAVSLYLQGKAIPKEKLLRNIFHVLNLPYKTLEDLLENEAVKGLTE